MKPNVTIQFPNLLMIPVFSIVGIIMKIFGLSECSWTSTVLILPFILYFAWCIGYCILAILALAIFRLHDKFKK